MTTTALEIGDGRAYGDAMVPVIPTKPAFEVPTTVRPPGEEEISEEGIGGVFRGVWYIAPGWPAEDARELLRWERSVVQAIGELADRPEKFEALACIVEEFVADDDSLSIRPEDASDLAAHERAVLEERLAAGRELLIGIDLGVAGLVAALSSSGFYPAASCRGHTADHAWSDRPVVFFAGALERVLMLRDAVLGAGCQLGSGAGNGEHLVTIHAPSVLAMMDLAQAILDADLTPHVTQAAADATLRLDGL